MRPRLLVLDDEETIRQILSVFFEEKGYEVAVAGTAADAVALSGGTPFDLAIFDINLAGENGLELLTLFKSKYPALPIIIFTGLEDEEDTIERAMLRGANGFMQKNEPLNNLFEMVKSYVAKPKG